MAKEFRTQVLNLSGVRISISPNDTSGFLRHDGTFAVAVVPAQTGQFVDTSKTGGFVSISQTGNFVDNSKTGQFITTAATGQFATNALAVMTFGNQSITGLKKLETISMTQNSSTYSDILYPIVGSNSGSYYRGYQGGEYGAPQSNLEMLSVLAGALGVPDVLRYKAVVGQELFSGGAWITDPSPPNYPLLLAGTSQIVSFVSAADYSAGISGRRFVIDAGVVFIRPGMMFLTRGWDQANYGYQAIIESSQNTGSTFDNIKISGCTVPTNGGAVSTFILGDTSIDRYFRLSILANVPVTTGSLRFSSLRGLSTTVVSNQAIYSTSGGLIGANGYLSGTTNLGVVFVTRNETGQFAPSGLFVTSGQTGNFVTTNSPQSISATKTFNAAMTFNNNVTSNGSLLLTGATTGNSAFLLMNSVSGIRSFDFIPNQTYSLYDYNGGIDVISCALLEGYSPNPVNNSLNWKSRTLYGDWRINAMGSGYPILHSGDTFIVRTTGTQTILGAKNFQNDLYIKDVPNNVKVFDFTADNQVRLQDNGGNFGLDFNNAAFTTGTGFGFQVFNWQKKQLTGTWSAGNILISGNRVITTADTGNFGGGGGAGVNAGVSFISVSGVGISGNVSLTGIGGIGVSLSGNAVVISGFSTSSFVTTSQTGNFISNGQTGSFITTAQTGQFAPSGMTGQFITTAQTGIFVARGETGNAFYPRFGNPANYLTGTSPNGVASITVSGGVVSGAITFSGLNGEAVILSGQTILFSGANTGGLVSISQTGQFITTAMTGLFITTSMTGQFAPSGMTGQFITTAQTGNFISNGMTGILVPRAETGNAFYPRFGNPSNFLTAASATGQITQFLPIVTGQVISGNWNFTGISGINVYTSGNYIVWSGQGLGGGGGGTAGVTSVIYSGGNAINGNIRITGQHGISISGGSAADNMLFINPIRGTVNLPTGNLMGNMPMDGGPGPFNYVYINWNSGENFQYVFKGSGYGPDPTKSPKIVFVHTGTTPGKTITCSFVNTGVTFFMTNGAPAFSGEPRFYSGIAWESNTTPSWIGINASSTIESHADVFQFTCIGKTVYGKMTHADAYIPEVILL